MAKLNNKNYLKEELVSDNIIEGKLKSNQNFKREDLEAINNLYCKNIVTKEREVFNLLCKFLNRNPDFKEKYLKKENEELTEAFNILLPEKDKSYFPADKRDFLNVFNTPEELIQFSKSFQLEIKYPVKIMYEDDEFIFVEVLSWESSKYYGTSCVWCVASEGGDSYWKTYRDEYKMRIFMIRKYKDKSAASAVDRFVDDRAFIGTDKMVNFCISVPKERGKTKYLCEFRNSIDTVVSRIQGGRFNGEDVIREFSQKPNADPELKEILKDWSEVLLTTDMYPNGTGNLNPGNPLPAGAKIKTQITQFEYFYSADKEKITDGLVIAGHRDIEASSIERSFHLDINERFLTFYAPFHEFLRKDNKNAIGLAQILIDALPEEDLKKLPSLIAEDSIIFVAPASCIGSYLSTSKFDDYIEENGITNITIPNTFWEQIFSNLKLQRIPRLAIFAANGGYELTPYNFPILFSFFKNLKQKGAQPKIIKLKTDNLDVGYSYQRLVREPVLNTTRITINDEKDVYLIVTEEGTPSENMFNDISQL